MTPNNIRQLGQLIRSGFTDWQSIADINVTPKGDLLLFNYNMHATFNARWNWLERNSRGLIMNTYGECIARPFEKFFNWGQHGFTTNAPIRRVYEKMDGSLGISYWHNGEIKVATRGSFESEQALWATERLQQKDFTNFPQNWTLLFEVIYPENRVVVNYNGLETLTLLAIRDTETGNYLHWDTVQGVAHEFDFSLPDVWFSTGVEVGDILAQLPNLTANEEGYVIEFEDGQRFKFKGDAYKILHKKISGLSFKNYLEARRRGVADEYVADIPDEFMGDVEIWRQMITGTVNVVKSEIREAMQHAPTDDRKEFALWCKENVPHLMTYMFLVLDGRSPLDAIYKREFGS